MTIANRIFMVCVFAILLVTWVGFYTAKRMDMIRETVEYTVSRDIAVYENTSKIRILYNQLFLRQRELLADFIISTGHTADVARFSNQKVEWLHMAQNLEDIIADTRQDLVEIKKKSLFLPRSANYERIIQALTSMHDQIIRYREDTLRYISQLQEKQPDISGISMTTLANQEGQLNKLSDDIRKYIDINIADGRDYVTHIYRMSLFWLIIVLGGVIILTLIATLLIRKALIGNLSQLVRIMENVGQGNLSHKVDISGNDEFGRLAKSLNMMIEGLREIAFQTRKATLALDKAVAEIHIVARAQKLAVDDQRSAVRRTVARVEDITSGGGMLIEKATTLIASTEETTKTAAHGLKAVEDSGQMMSQIAHEGEVVAGHVVALSERTNVIGEVIDTVNDLSERAHFLALNAALEASAAGEHGRSFAIVAAEMQTLADQSREATSHVSTILGDIQKKINAAVLLTEESLKRAKVGQDQSYTTQKTIENMLQKLGGNIDVFHQIVASASQQQLMIEQVMSTLQKISERSHTTVEDTEKLDQSARNLGRISSQLLVLSDRYRV